MIERATLEPFLRKGLDILFVGLNPALGSSRNGHYFSVNAAFWNQLFAAGLITAPIKKDQADTVVFGSTRVNRNGWNYGVTDLVTEWAISDSAKVAPNQNDCKRLVSQIEKYRPRAVIVMHSKVLSELSRFLGIASPLGTGSLGKLLSTADCEFFGVSFPHGNSVPAQAKIRVYEEVRGWLQNGASPSEVSRGAPEATSVAPKEPSSQQGRRQDKIEFARRIDHRIADHLRRTGTERYQAKDLMPMLVREGFFAKDHKEGLPLRKLLRELDDAGMLGIMTTVQVIRGPKNRRWYFELPRG